MKKVWKYVLFALDDYVDMDMPRDAEILSVHNFSGNSPEIWALVDPSAPMETRHFRIAGTGHPIDDNLIKFIGTFPFPHGLIFHLFEISKWNN